MKKKTSIKKAICLLLAVLSISSMLCIAASADTLYSNTLSFASGGFTRYTSAVSKTTNSSCYVNYSSGNAPYFVAAAGGTNSTGSTHTDCSGGFYYRCTVGQKRYMYNYIREQGFSYMQIRATYAGAASATVVYCPNRYSTTNVLSESNYMQ